MARVTTGSPRDRGMTRSTLRLALLLAGVAGLGGCVERELVIDSNPQGALVFLNDQEIGRTPLRKDFVWYGTYDVVVRKEGYETLKTRSPVIAPAWQFVPFDLVAELLPTRLKDTHALNYTLTPTSENTIDPPHLVRRAEKFRDKLESGEKAPKSPKAPKTQPSTQPSK